MVCEDLQCSVAGLMAVLIGELFEITQIDDSQREIHAILSSLSHLCFDGIRKRLIVAQSGQQVCGACGLCGVDTHFKSPWVVIYMSKLYVMICD